MGARPLFSRLALLFCSASLGLTACGQSAGSQPAPATENATDGGTMLEVVNHSSSDMDIYLIRIGQRVRVGTAAANVTTRIQLHPAQVAGIGTVTFYARPMIPGLARPMTSEPTVLRPGDVVTLDIPGP